MILLNLALLCLQFTMWTFPEDLTLLLVKFHLPPKYAVLVGLALHFLPVMEKDLAAIYETQQARGLELSTFFQKVKGLMPVMLPLIPKALKRSEEVALSMELKGYGLYQERTFLHNIALSKLDYGTGAIICTYFSLIIYFNGIL
ncbi:MAG: energy-coupling factor transporter transmembrane component T [Dehalobacterium sp.]